MAISGATPGIGSGLDVNSIISQLVAVQNQPITKLNQRMSLIDIRKTGLQDISNGLSLLRNAAVALRDPALWTVSAPPAPGPSGSPTQTVSASSPGVLSAFKAGAATNGSYEINVQAIARGETKQSTAGFSAATVNDVLHISVAGATASDVSINAGDDLAAIAAKINATAGIGVSATVTNGQLQMTANATGAAQTVTVSSDAGTSAAMGLTTLRNAQDARWTVDGGAVQTSSSNSITNLIAGVDAGLSGTGTATLKVTDSAAGPTQPVDKVAEKLQAFVDAYNAVMKSANAKMSEKPVKDPKTTLDAQKGALFSDSSLRGVSDQLRNWRYHSTTSTGSAAFDALADLGIGIQTTAGADANVGALKFDKAKFVAAYEADPAAARKLVDNVTADPSSEGLSQWSERQINSMINFGGSLYSAVQGEDAQKASLQNRADRLTDRLARYESRLRSQFARLDTSLGTIRSENSYLSGQFATLSR